MGIAHRKGERSQALKGRNTIPFGIMEFIVRSAGSYFPHEKLLRCLAPDSQTPEKQKIRFFLIKKAVFSGWLKFPVVVILPPPCVSTPLPVAG
jgi:hypothetical protein